MNISNERLAIAWISTQYFRTAIIMIAKGRVNVAEALKIGFNEEDYTDKTSMPWINYCTDPLQEIVDKVNARIEQYMVTYGG